MSIDTLCTPATSAVDFRQPATCRPSGIRYLLNLRFLGAGPVVPWDGLQAHVERESWHHANPVARADHGTPRACHGLKDSPERVMGFSRSLLSAKASRALLGLFCHPQLPERVMAAPQSVSWVPRASHGLRARPERVMGISSFLRLNVREVVGRSRIPLF